MQFPIRGLAPPAIVRRPSGAGCRAARRGIRMEKKRGRRPNVATSPSAIPYFFFAVPFQTMAHFAWPSTIMTVLKYSPREFTVAIWNIRPM